ncbi:hypothetical protein [Paenibacillus qinlingensis]
MQALRNWEYYSMTDSFTDCMKDQKTKKHFHISMRSALLEKIFFWLIAR